MDKYSFDRFVKKENQNKKKKIIRLVITFLAVSAVSYGFIYSDVFKNNQTAYYIFIGLFATVVAYFNGYFKAPKEELNGYFEGKVTFTPHEIIIGEDSYALNTIQKITIHNQDYVGKKEKEFGEFEKQQGSFGVNNQLILDLGQKQFIETDFKQNRENEMEKIKSILIAYHLQDKLSFDDLVNLLKIEYDIDKNELKKSIERKR